MPAPLQDLFCEIRAFTSSDSSSFIFLISLNALIYESTLSTPKLESNNLRLFISALSVSRKRFSIYAADVPSSSPAVSVTTPTQCGRSPKRSEKPPPFISTSIRFRSIGENFMHSPIRYVIIVSDLPEPVVPATSI